MKIIKIGAKDYPVKFTFGNIKRTKLKTEKELQSGDITLMLEHLTNLFQCGLNGLGNFSEKQVEDIIQEYLDNDGDLVELIQELSEEYAKSLGLKNVQLP